MNAPRRLGPIAVLLLCLATAPPLAAGMRAGTDRTDITPLPGHFPVATAGSMRQSAVAGSDERIHCRTLVLGDEKTLVSFTLVDSCLIPRRLLDEAKRRASQRTGIPVAHLNVAATHTHSAPAAAPAFQSVPTLDYQIYLADRIAESIVLAHGRLEPCEVGWAVGENREQVFNRRWFVTEPYENPFGSTGDQVRMNPGYDKGKGKVSRPAGPVDPAVPVLAVRAAGGKKRPIAVLANYALHYVGGPPRSASGAAQLSGDYFDRFDRIFSEMAAPGSQDFIAILSNGTSGDINNIDYSGPPPAKAYAPGEKMEAVARSVAASAHAALATIAYRDELTIATVARDLDLGVRKPSQAEVDRALEILSSPQEFLDGNYTAVEAIYARETLQIREYPDTVPVRLQAVRIGDLCLLTTPCETFVEIGLELKAASPFGTTVVIELANGYNGYLPTPRQHEWGGYETWRAKSSYLEKEASVKIVAAFREMMAEFDAGR